jgi:hypothetical protein
VATGMNLITQTKVMTGCGRKEDYLDNFSDTCAEYFSPAERLAVGEIIMH